MAEKRLDILIGARDRATRVFGRINRAFSGFASRLTSLPVLLGGLAGAAGVGALGRFAVGAASSFEQVEVAMTTMLGSAEQAKGVLSDLTQFAASTPFQFPELTDASKKLLAFGTPVKELLPTLRALGDVAAGVGIPIGDIAEIFGKARVQGRLFAEDINQLTGRGIPVISELAKQFGIAESEVRGLVESGKVGFPQIKKVFSDLTSEGGQFAGMMDAQSKTLGGLFSTFKDNLGLIARDFGQALLPALKEVTAATLAALPAIREYTRSFAEGVGDMLTRAVEFGKIWKDTIDEAAFVFFEFPQSIKLGALTAATTFSGFVDTFHAGMKQVGENIGAFVINSFERMRTMFINMGTLAKNFATNFTDVIGAMFEAIRTGSLGPLADLGDALNEGMIKAIEIPPEKVKREASAITKALMTARDEAEAELLRRQEQRQRDRESRARDGSGGGVGNLADFLGGGTAAAAQGSGGAGGGNRGTSAIELGQRFLGLAQTGKANDLERQRTDATKKLVEQGREQLRVANQLVAAMNALSGGGASASAGIDLGFS